MYLILREPIQACWKKNPYTLHPRTNQPFGVDGIIESRKEWQFLVGFLSAASEFLWSAVIPANNYNAYRISP